jgi:hypothetical protein
MALAPFTSFRNLFLQDHIVAKAIARRRSSEWRLAAGG